MSVNPKQIKALRELSQERQDAASLLPQVLANTRLTLYYDACRLHLAALCMKHGLRIHNHECYEAFLEKLNESNLAISFRAFRIKRNALNYEAKHIAIEEAEQIILLMQQFLVAIEK